MTRWKAGAGLLATAFLALGPVVPAGADPIGVPVPPAQGAPTLLRLEVDTMTPRIVTAGTPQLTVTGRVTNTGDRRVDDIRVKVQRGEPVESDRDLRDLPGLATDSASSPFADVARSLAPGDTAPVSVTVPVRGVEQSLALTQPGVYPVLVNVNGRPDYGGQARLAEVSLPLPVLSVPSGPSTAPDQNPPSVTILWPILDTQPRRLPTSNGQTVLTDDDLADSLSVGGRLYGLVDAVDQAAATSGTLPRSLCFAVDPDLLQTVSAMSAGYKVRTDDGRTVNGKGAVVATNWLARLAELTHGRCVISVPYADADLVALSRSGAVDLAQLSIASSSIVADLLGPVQPAKELFWPAGGTFDQRTLVDLASIGPTTVLADPARLQNVKGQAPYMLNGIHTNHPVRALPIDPLLSQTLSGPGGKGGSLQDGLAALTFRTVFDQAASDHVVVAPPRRWTASETELGGYLDLAQQLFDGRFANPQLLEQQLSGADQGTATGLAYTPQDSAQEIPPSVSADVVRINTVKRDLLDAMDEDNTTNVDPNDLLSPMQYGLLRGMSTAWRGRAPQAALTVDRVDEELDALRGKVVVNNHDRPLTLASGDSPIPIGISNGLPVAIVVRIHLTASPGLRPEQYQDIRIPAASGISRYIPAEVIRAGRFTVDAQLTTPGGTKLGSTARMELTSTSYGIVTVALTGVAGGVLVLLTTFRIFRRVRTARAGRAGNSQAPVEP
ncbi:MAG: hypothetical protein GEV28_20485 [Actinophytocola sp.]|uniref:DUF6049 family protein n=1 Tax=Actinophytocola sp. TaxID=1872138 RepID=UPI0013222AA1|nr:DUF6049 family protein [Actinophytocola sp.]MPZ82644.1 hypothetical protein [Actinophytocola sp.]